MWHGVVCVPYNLGWLHTTAAGWLTAAACKALGVSVVHMHVLSFCARFLFVQDKLAWVEYHFKVMCDKTGKQRNATHTCQALHGISVSCNVLPAVSGDGEVGDVCARQLSKNCCTGCRGVSLQDSQHGRSSAHQAATRYVRHFTISFLSV